MDFYVTEALGGACDKLMLVVIFAGLAIVLALVGVYGAISFAVAQRTRESV
jgi:ABC-type antimicrobial peptide transport system permease subunit